MITLCAFSDSNTGFFIADVISRGRLKISLLFTQGLGTVSGETERQGQLSFPGSECHHTLLSSHRGNFRRTSGKQVTETKDRFLLR